MNGLVSPKTIIQFVILIKNRIIMMIAGSTIRWLLFLLVPYIIGMAVHFLIPLQFMLDSLPKSQQIYNEYKLQSEQNSVRTLAILKQKIIKNRVQLKWRSSDLFMNIYKKDSIYMNTLNSNIQLRNMLSVSGNETDQDVTMWFAPGVTEYSQLNLKQKQCFQKYLNAQPFIRATIISDSAKKLPSFQMIMNYSGFPLLFKYPTVKTNRIKNIHDNIYSQYYNRTKYNWQKHGISYTSHWDQGIFELCYVIIQKSTTFTGVICQNIAIKQLAQQLTILGNPTFNYSSNIYYLVTPAYQDYAPQILFRFNDSGKNTLVYPNQQMFPIASSQPKKYWDPLQNQYQLYLFQLKQKETYFQAPIRLKDVNGKLINVLFLITRNNFALADFNNETKVRSILITILVPSIILIGLSIAISIIVIKCLLGDLQSGIYQLDNHCNYILKGSLDLVIPQYNKTKDISDLYQACEKLNNIYKVSSQNFYIGSYPQRFLKYYQVYQLFKEYGYNVENVEQLLGNCLYNIKDYARAIQYYDLSINHTIQSLKKDYGSLQQIWRLKLKRSKKLNKQYFLLKQAMLRKKLFKIILCRIWTLNSPFQQPQLQANFLLFKRSCGFEYKATSQLVCIYLFEARYHMSKRRFEKAQICIRKGQRSLNSYEKQNEKGVQKEKVVEAQVPPEILQAYFDFVLGTYNLMTGKSSEACRLYIKALQHNIYSLEINKIVAEQLKNLLKSQNLLSRQVLNTSYFSIFNEAKQRQFVILHDWTRHNSAHSLDVKQWRRKTILYTIKIFDQYLQNQDRISLATFDQDIQIVFCLTLKKNNEELIRRYIQGLKDKPAKRVAPNYKRAFKDAIQKIKKLTGLKILIVFLKQQTIINSDKLMPIVSDLQKYQLIFLKPTVSQEQKDSNYYIFGMDDQEDLDRVLMPKKQIQQSNQINLF